MVVGDRYDIKTGLHHAREKISVAPEAIQFAGGMAARGDRAFQVGVGQVKPAYEILDARERIIDPVLPDHGPRTPVEENVADRAETNPGRCRVLRDDKN
jgi:hypothetical protein